ncbi:hypothetical protein [Natronobacterium texcoconense]|uniref:hypothetical protein n=1 Tax=Natronobacterium texcoconense TaxID=1095778 RepID=UPI0011133C35|nr:hypothetical protein [Natronobacterium texcoconense]
MIKIDSDDQDEFLEVYMLHLPSEESFEFEYVSRDDWNNLSDPCPECSGTEFDHIRYEGGHYGHHENTVIQRNDYWDQKGSLYTVCRSCDEVLYKSLAYDVLEAEKTGAFDEFLDLDSEE